MTAAPRPAPPAPGAAPPAPWPQGRARPVSWPPPSPTVDSEPPTDQFAPSANGIDPHVPPPYPQAQPHAQPQSYPAVGPDPFVARPDASNTAGYAAVAGGGRPVLKWIAAAAGLVVLVLIGVAGGALFAPEPPPPVLEVISVPPGATVTLDGTQVPGVAPVRITQGLAIDRAHRVEVAMSGYETWTTTFQPTHGLVKQIAVLTPQRATLTVDTVPAGAHVWIDGVLYGSAPIEVPSLPIGREVEVRASKPQHADARQTVRITADDLRPSLRLELTPD